MNAPLIWIVFPILFGMLLLIFRRYKTLVIIAAVGVSFWLAYFAWTISFDQIFVFGVRSLKISESFSLLGREFILSNSERPIIALFYFLNTFWILGTFYARPSRLFVPYSMIVIGLLTAVIAVEPFLFAALILETIVLISVPLLAEPGQATRKGALRFLTFQTLAMPFILFTSWMVTGVEAGPSDLELLTRAAALLGIGLAFSLAVFPFHSWIPMIAEESQPYTAAYLFFIFPMGVSLFSLGLLDRFVWLRDSESLLMILQSLGGLMVLVGGLWAAFENHLGRILGFASVMEIGYILLSISLSSEKGILIYFWLFIPRAVSYIVWSMSLSRLNKENSQKLDFSNSQGLGLKFPFSAGAIVLAIFSLAGIPLLAGFPVRLVLWKELAQSSAIVGVATILGAIFLVVAGLRSLFILFSSALDEDENKRSGVEESSETEIGDIENHIPPQERSIRKTIFTGLFISFVLLLIFVGNFPQNYLPTLRIFLNVFEHLGK